MERWNLRNDLDWLIFLHWNITELSVSCFQECQHSALNYQRECLQNNESGKIILQIRNFTKIAYEASNEIMTVHLSHLNTQAVTVYIACVNFKYTNSSLEHTLISHIKNRSLWKVTAMFSLCTKMTKEMSFISVFHLKMILIWFPAKWLQRFVSTKDDSWHWIFSSEQIGDIPYTWSYCQYYPPLLFLCWTIAQKVHSWLHMSDLYISVKRYGWSFINLSKYWFFSWGRGLYLYYMVTGTIKKMRYQEYLFTCCSLYYFFINQSSPYQH